MARKRAAVDIFLKTEMDKHLVEAWDEFERATEALKSAPSVEEFCEAVAYSNNYLAIRRYLNIHELIAVGIKNKMFDDRTCFDFWASRF